MAILWPSKDCFEAPVSNFRSTTVVCFWNTLLLENTFYLHHFDQKEEKKCLLSYFCGPQHFFLLNLAREQKSMLATPGLSIC